MIIIQLAGGLGNQLFQYALYLQLKSLGKEVKIDDASGFAQDEKRFPALEPFGVSYERPTRKELIQMLDSSLLPWSRVRRKLFGRHKKSYFEEDKRYHPEIMTWDDIYLEGYWQTEKYFGAIADEVRQVYDTDRLLRNMKGDRLEDWLRLIDSTQSVSMHVRRGDYLLPENQALFGGICTDAYYREAMAQIMKERPDCRFYLFTNDKQWARAQIERYKKTEVCETDAETADAKLYHNIQVVDLGERNDYAEFVLMSRCKHNILANSSFSWWASYMNRNADKIVLVPDRWLNGWDCEDIYREDMRRVRV